MWMWKDKYRSEEETLEVAWPCVACVAGAKRGEGRGDLQEARKVNADREGGGGGEPPCYSAYVAKNYIRCSTMC